MLKNINIKVNKGNSIMNHLASAVTIYRVVKDRVRAEEQDIDDVTLADTVEGLTDLHEIIAAVVRAALVDEALVSGLKSRIKEMQDRLARLEERAAKRRQICRSVMVETDIKKITAPDCTISLRPGTPSLVVVDEASIPASYWEPQAPRLKRQELVVELKQGSAVPGAQLSNPEPVLSVRSK
jgi:Siphovirus Gp157